GRPQKNHSRQRRLGDRPRQKGSRRKATLHQRRLVDRAGFAFVNHAGAGYFSGLTHGLLGLLLP
ncbi:hypothetical protein, partial [Franconibacter helveticus]|uniref:hypothetical protein n=1 Tax=Franconibacter helveticus TaxID=357240 RepID=UPI00131EFDC5